MELIKSYIGDFTCDDTLINTDNCFDEHDSTLKCETVLVCDTSLSNISSPISDINFLVNELARETDEKLELKSSRDIKENLIQTLVIELTAKISTLNEEITFLRNDILEKNDMIRYLQNHDRLNSTLFTADNDIKDIVETMKGDMSKLHDNNRHLNDMILFLVKQVNGEKSDIARADETFSTQDLDSSMYLERLMALRDEPCRIDEKHITDRRQRTRSNKHVNNDKKEVQNDQDEMNWNIFVNMYLLTGMLLSHERESNPWLRSESIEKVFQETSGSQPELEIQHNSYNL